MNKTSLKLILLFSILGLSLTIIMLTNTILQPSILVIMPLLTANAYAPNGFYDYYRGECDESCLTIDIDIDQRFDYKSSRNALVLLNEKQYEIIPDISLMSDKNYIQKYDTIVVLHNEYVTTEIFEMLTNHPNVYYLYPNALYAQVKVNLENNTMTLIKGHGYQNVSNAFNWKYDNSKNEYDNLCLDHSWEKIENGWQLNCYPENAILNNTSILDFITT